MRHLVLAGVFLAAIAGAPLAIAQGDTYVPALGDIMNTVQMRHIKLWFAGKNENWELARYELERIRSGLEDAANLYHGIPADYVGATVEPVVTIHKGIEAKDGAQFAAGFNALTAACNACHQGIGRGFIVMQVPAGQPFSDQSFSPPKQ